MLDGATRFWVDTDFGFDDLWALIVLQHFDVPVDGVSLVSGNTALPQVMRNAEASSRVFGFDWPFYAGAATPLQRQPVTAEHVLGSLGMCSRGKFLPYSDSNGSDSTYSDFTGSDFTGSDMARSDAANSDASSTDTGRLDKGSTSQAPPIGAIDALARSLNEDTPHHILALGPLTNLAQLLALHPETASRIRQITWLGGSRGRGNQSPYAEFNALADPEALSLVAGSDIPFRMIDLELCRQVSFAPTDMPVMHGINQQLVADLLGGYLDIALQRGRSAMSIYDPLAALSIVKPELFTFASASLLVELAPNLEYGRTVIDFSASRNAATVEIVESVDSEKARNACLSVLIDA